MSQADIPQIRPRLTLRVGITGHRPNKLDAQGQSRVAGTARAVLEGLCVAAAEVQAAHSAVLAGDGPDVRLVSALAEGADTILAHAARDAGMKLDVVLPFRRATYMRAQQMKAEALATFEDLVASARSVLELDGDADRADAEAYLAAGRLMLAHTDVLVAVWDGAPAAGVGGTGQIVAEALDAGMPVVWIRPDGAACFVSKAVQLADFDLGAPVLGEAAPGMDRLTAEVQARLAPPASGSKARARLERFQSAPTPTSSSWCAYDLLRYLVLGRRFQWRIDYRPDAGTEAVWTRFRGRAEEIGGAGFAQVLTDRLEARWRHADAMALHFSHAYRSTYVANFGLAALAVAIGLFSVFWWNHESSIAIKAGFVLVEVALIGLILWMTRIGGSSRHDWHKRWLEARAVAELLRPARLPALIGSTAAAPMQPGQDDAPDAWVEWYVRATLRQIGPPTAVLDADALRIAINAAIEDEIDGQLDYNEGAHGSAKHLDHWLHVWGERLFLATFFVGIGYILVAILATSGVIYLPSEWKQAIKAFTTFVGGGFPALGAALFGIRATGDFRVAGEQAIRTKGELETVKAQLGALHDAPTRERAARLLTDLTRVLAGDLRDWAKIYQLRELTLPG